MFLEQYKTEQYEKSIGALQKDKFLLSYYSIGSLQSQVSGMRFGAKSRIWGRFWGVMFELFFLCSKRGLEIRTKEWLVDAIVRKLIVLYRMF